MLCGTNGCPVLRVTSESVWDTAVPLPGAVPQSELKLSDSQAQATHLPPFSSSSPSYFFSASYRNPVIIPVWWILFSTLLSWVIWGIIPKVSKHSCPYFNFDPGTFKIDLIVNNIGLLLEHFTIFLLHWSISITENGDVNTS